MNDYIPSIEERARSAAVAAMRGHAATKGLLINNERMWFHLLTNRVRNTLHRAGIHNEESLGTLTDDDLLNLRNLGVLGLQEIKGLRAGGSPLPATSALYGNRKRGLLWDDVPLTQRVTEQMIRHRERLREFAIKRIHLLDSPKCAAAVLFDTHVNRKVYWPCSNAVRPESERFCLNHRGMIWEKDGPVDG